MEKDMYLKESKEDYIGEFRESKGKGKERIYNFQN